MVITKFVLTNPELFLQIAEFALGVFHPVPALNRVNVLRQFNCPKSSLCSLLLCSTAAKPSVFFCCRNVPELLVKQSRLSMFFSPRRNITDQFSASSPQNVLQHRMDPSVSLPPQRFGICSRKLDLLFSFST